MTAALLLATPAWSRASSPAGQVARHFLPWSLPLVARRAGSDFRQGPSTGAQGSSKLPPLESPRLEAAATPPGGTVRSLAVDPFHPGRVLLGTPTTVVFASSDGGTHWQFLARVANQDTGVISALIPDPHVRGRWYASLWSWASRNGGVYVSQDGGVSWQALFTGHAVRALALAPSDSRVLVAAALDGVFRSQDGGQHWERISPRSDRELQNIESVAIDPQHPEEIYVGTWHLPWKTVNGGHDWWQMRQGVIDDSDVFSIAVDRQHPTTLYLSACSGIYRSDDHGNHFRKIQGIPYSARRTPALVQDPQDAATIYAGTTQGLWVTHDGGASWARITSPDMEINSVVLVPEASSGAARRSRILLGTNFAGVLASDDGGVQFHFDNSGFSSRHVSSVAPAPGGRYVAVTGDQRWGGVFFASAAAAGENTGGWKQLPAPDGNHDVYSLHWSREGLLAATATGIFRLAPGATRWQPVATAPQGRVYQLASPAPMGTTVLAAAQTGLYRSQDGGRSWTWLRAAPAPLYQLLAWPQSSLPGARVWLFAAGDGYVVRSPDLGEHFLAGRLGIAGVIRQLAVATTKDAPLLLAATSRGLYQSSDLGASWTLSGHGLPAEGIRAVHVQPDGLFALADQVGDIYRSLDGGRRWQRVTLPAHQEAQVRAGAGVLAHWSIARVPASAVRPSAPPREAAIAGAGSSPAEP